MRNRWMRLGRALWILLALNSVYTLGLSLWVMFQFLQAPSARIVQGLAEHGLALEFYAAFFLISIPLYFLVYFIVALLIFLRRPNDGFVLFTAIFLLNFGASTATPGFPEFVQFYNNPPLWYGSFALISSLFSWTLLVAFLILYPDGQFVPRWSWVLAVLGFCMTTAWAFFPNEFASATAPLGIFAAVTAVVVTGACFGAQFWRYRHHSSPLQRQQTKWFVFALAVFLASTVLSFLSPTQTGRMLTPAESIWEDLATMMTGLSDVVIPIAVGIAILRYRLWDIDIIIRRTLVYSVLTGLLALIYFGGVVIFQQVFRDVIGHSTDLAIVISTLAIAVLFLPLRRRVQNVIDRRFYRRKYDAQKVLEQFAATARDEVDLVALANRLVSVVQETMQPEHVSLWLKPTTDRRRPTADVGGQSREEITS